MIVYLYHGAWTRNEYIPIGEVDEKKVQLDIRLDAFESSKCSAGMSALPKQPKIEFRRDVA